MASDGAADPLAGGLAGFARALVSARPAPIPRAPEADGQREIGPAAAEIPRPGACLQAAPDGPPWPLPSPSAVAACLALLRAGAVAHDAGAYWRVQRPDGGPCMLASARTVAAAQAALGAA